MTKYIIKSTLNASESNINFRGVTRVYYHGKDQKLLGDENSDNRNIIGMNLFNYFVNEYGYNRECDTKRSWIYKNPDKDEPHWHTKVEIIKVEV